MKKISKLKSLKSKVANNGATTFDNSFFSGKRTLRHPKPKAHGYGTTSWRKAPDLGEDLGIVV
jgi:hypothetical protein